MIFTGLKDENGNIIPVQGAGTVYDEQKNSLALGNGTSAIGQDQLVFGRYNEEDANKVEIVGGGEAEGGEVSLQIGDLIDSVFYRNYAHVKIWYAGTSGDDLRTCISTLYGIPESNISMVEPFTHLDIEVDFVLLLIQSSGRLCYAVHCTDGNWYDTSSYISYDNSVNFPSAEQIDTTKQVRMVWPANREAGVNFPMNVASKFPAIYDYYKGVQITPANIRTLDWNGHEHLAGSLAIGEDSVAGTKGQLVFGKGNMANAYKAEIVGNGIDNIDDITDDVVTYISTLPVGMVLPIKTNATSWLKELSLRIVTHTYSEFASKFPLKHFDTIDFELMHSADASRIIACCEVVSEIPNVWSTPDLDIRHDKAAPMLLVRDSTYKLLLVSPTELAVDRTSLTTRFSYANGERISGVTFPKNIRTLDWDGTQWNAGDITCDDGNGNTISMRDLLSRIAVLEAAYAQTESGDPASAEP